MAAFGNNSYPGVYQPAWWYATTGTSTTTNIISTWQDFAEQPKAAPVAPVKPRTAVEWLRGRVQEMCDLAGLADAV